MKKGVFSTSICNQLEDVTDDIVALLRPKLNAMKDSSEKSDYLGLLGDLEEMLDNMIDANKGSPLDAVFSVTVF